MRAEAMTNLPSPIPKPKVKRNGLELGVYARSAGVWLDRRELEKSVTFTLEDAEDHARRHGPRDYHADHEEDDFDDHNHRNRQGGRKRSRLLDIFDF
jgi:Zn-finger nucleic acid-binding protein